MSDQPTVRQRLEADLKTAMRERDRVRISILRTTLSALSNAEAVDVETSAAMPALGVYAADVARRELDDDDVADVIRRERDEILASVDDYERGGQVEAAAELREKASVLDAYLPT